MIQIIVSSPSTGTETIELEERELLLIATNESERKLAITKYTDASARSKSKSPRRSKAPRSPFSESPENQLPSPLPIPPVPQTANPGENRSNFGSHHATRSSPTASVSPPAHALRRPHTSAGPRDKANSRPHHRHHEHHRERENREREDESPGRFSSVFRSSRRPESARPAAGGTSIGSKDSLSSAPPSAYPYPPTHARRSSREVNGGGGVTPGSGPGALASLSDPGTVRAWEEELARIERTSRRVSADMLRFNLKRFRMRATRPKTASSSITSGSP